MAILLPLFSISPIVKASSVDTTQRLPYTPHRTTPKKPQTPDSLSAISTISLSPSTSRSNISVSDLLKREIPKSTEVKPDGTYMGYDVWLPRAHKVEKPRSVFNAASLAYIGDCIFELYARRHFLFPPLSIEEYNDRVMAVVRCEAQDAMLQKLMNDNILSEEERGVLRWGKNVGSGKTKTKKRAGVAVYNRASSLETLVGYLYLTNVQRLEEIMLKLGFHIGDSSLPIVERIDAHAVIYTRAGSGSTDTNLLKKKPSRSQSLESRLLFTYAIDGVTFQGSGFLNLSNSKVAGSDRFCT